MSLFPKWDRIDATSSVEKLQSQRSDANDAAELVNQSTKFVPICHKYVKLEGIQVTLFN